jgi:hypothetical protein
MRSSFATVVLITSFLLGACEESPLDTESSAGTIVVTASGTGGSSVAAGLTLTVDGGSARSFDSSGRLTLRDVPEGDHLIRLFGVPGNCSVDGSNPRSVVVGAGGRVEITFTVVCAPVESGGLRVTVTTTGTDLDDDGYGLAVAGAPLRRIETGAIELFTGLAPGMHLVTLKDVADNCETVGGNPQPYTVVKDKTVQAQLLVVCGGGGPQ